MLNSKLFRIVHDDVTVILKRMNPEDIKNISDNILDGKKPNKRNLQFDYIKSVFIELMKINEALDRCKLCADLLRKEANKKETDDKSVKFYSSYYHIIISSMYDNIFRLINRILFTGLSQKDINSHNTLNNIFIKGTDIEKLVNEFYNIIRKSLEYRNEIVHENVFNFVYDYFDPQIYQYFEMKEIEGIKIEFSDLFKAIDLQMKNEIKKVVLGLNDDIIKYNNAITKILDSLYFLYSENYHRQRNLTTASTGLTPLGW